MKSQEPQEKKFRQLSDEELEKVNGGRCYTDNREECMRRGGIFDKPTCKCSVSID